MLNSTFITQDLRVRIEADIAHIDQRRLDGEPWKEIDRNQLPVTGQGLVSPMRTSPLKVALLALNARIRVTSPCAPRFSRSLFSLIAFRAIYSVAEHFRHLRISPVLHRPCPILP